jgi:hypothetical protein
MSLATALTVSYQGVFISGIDAASIGDTGAHIAVVIGLAVSQDLADFDGTGRSRVEWWPLAATVGLVDVQTDR